MLVACHPSWVLWSISSRDLPLVAFGPWPFELVTCHISDAGRLHRIFSVRANKELVKDILTCTALTPSTYKTRHPDDTDDPEVVGGSSEDEAEGLEEILGVSRRLQKPSQPEPTLEPTPNTIISSNRRGGGNKGTEEGPKKGLRYTQRHLGRQEGQGSKWGQL